MRSKRLVDKKEYHHLWYLRNKERHQRASKAWYRANKEKAQAYSKTYEGQRDRARKYEQNREVRREALLHYGGKCACCGESNLSFLTFDHKNNDGAQWRRLKRGPQARTLKRAGYPDDIQVLCYNCNCARHYHGGVCPHVVKE